MHLAVINHENNTPPISTLSAKMQPVQVMLKQKTSSARRMALGRARIGAGPVAAAAALRKQLIPGTLGLSKTGRPLEVKWLY